MWTGAAVKALRTKWPRPSRRSVTGAEVLCQIINKFMPRSIHPLTFGHKRDRGELPRSWMNSRNEKVTQRIWEIVFGITTGTGKILLAVQTETKSIILRNPLVKITSEHLLVKMPKASSPPFQTHTLQRTLCAWGRNNTPVLSQMPCRWVVFVVITGGAVAQSLKKLQWKQSRPHDAFLPCCLAYKPWWETRQSVA